MDQTDNGDIYFLGDNGYNSIVEYPDATTCIVQTPTGSEDFYDYLWEKRIALVGRESNEPVSLTDTKIFVFTLYRERLTSNSLSVVRDPVRRLCVIDLESKNTVETNTSFTHAAAEYAVTGEQYFGLADRFDTTETYLFDEEIGETTLVTRPQGQLSNLVRFP